MEKSYGTFERKKFESAVCVATGHVFNKRFGFFFMLPYDADDKILLIISDQSNPELLTSLTGPKSNGIEALNYQIMHNYLTGKDVNHNCF